ncbi:P-loop containing nucleoside triphosphate hydrolase protein, partial [Leucogyrophana mollusca]
MSATDRLAPFRFNTTRGHDLCREILKDCLPHDTHDFQLKAIAHLLDGEDVLLITATGTGKTDTFIRLMHIVRKLSSNPTLAPGVNFPPDPAMILTCPTKALEEEMETKMRNAQLTALAINADSVEAARKEDRNLFREVRVGITMVLVSPEQLKSNGFASVLDDPVFSQRVAMMAVDEAHLLLVWGKGFRKDFLQIGFMRSRLRKHIPLIAVTATLQAGKPTQEVCRFLGFKPGHYSEIRRSNMRHDIRIIFRTLQSGLGATKFPELDWIIEGGRKTLIFCRTIAVGFRVDAYLWTRLPDDSDRAKRIRMFNALNWKSYNDETLSLWRDNDPHSQIIVATSIFSVGIDAPSFDDVVIIGESEDVDQYWQMLGRIRPRQASNHPRGILYVTQGAIAAAKEVIEQGESAQVHKSGRRGGDNGGRSAMDVPMAELVLAECKVKKLDELYDNPSDDSPCGCSYCEVHPPAPRKTSCDCSG